MLMKGGGRAASRVGVGLAQEGRFTLVFNKKRKLILKKIEMAELAFIFSTCKELAKAI